MRSALFLLVAAALAAPGQDLRTLVVTASRVVALVPEEAVFELSAIGSSGAGEAQVIAALAGAGLRKEHLISAASVLYRPPRDPAYRQLLQYRFRLTVPGGRFTEIIEALEPLRRRPPSAIVDLTYSAAASPSARQAEETRARLIPILMEEARAKAAVLARAAGVRLGALLETRDGPAFIAPSPLTVSTIVAASRILTEDPIGRIAASPPADLGLRFSVTAEFAID